MAFGKAYTPDEDAILLRMRKEGFTFKQIAKELGRPAANLHLHLAYLLKRKKDTPRQAPPWTPEEDEQMFFLREEKKMQWKEIAPILGHSVTACSARYSWLKKKRYPDVEEVSSAVRMSVSREMPDRVLPKTYWRKCHDCGRQTPHYRCDKCREKWKTKYHVEEDEENQGGFDG